MGEQNIIELINGVPRDTIARFQAPISLKIRKGEHLAIVGPNGAGKNTPCRYPFRAIPFV